jgi:hypothetical protein
VGKKPTHMKKLTFFFITIFFSVTLHAQGSDTINLVNQLGTEAMFYQGKRLRMNQALEMMKSNEIASNELKLAQGNLVGSSIFGAAGGFCIGWPLGTALAGGDPEWTLAGIGVGLVLISIPFNSAYNKHVRIAVREYNAGINNTSMFRPQWKIEVNPAGVGLVCRF